MKSIILISYLQFILIFLIVFHLDTVKSKLENVKINF